MATKSKAPQADPPRLLAYGELGQHEKQILALLATARIKFWALKPAPSKEARAQFNELLDQAKAVLSSRGNCFDRSE